MAGGAWRGRSADPLAGASVGVMLALRAAPERVLTGAVRRIAQRRPELFERLGDARAAAFVIAPTDFPVAFRLHPRGVTGEVKVVRHDDQAPCAARISGPLALLLSLLEGGADADAAFFSRQVRIEGDTEAVVALHNTLEAAELGVADLLNLPALVRGPLVKAATLGLRSLRRLSGPRRT